MFFCVPASLKKTVANWSGFRVEPRSMPKRKISAEEECTSLRKRVRILKNKAALKSITQLVTKRPEVIQEVITVLVNLEHWHQESGGVVAAAKWRSNENSVSSRSSSSSAVSDSATDASKSSPHKCDANWLSDGYTRVSTFSVALLEEVLGQLEPVALCRFQLKAINGRGQRQNTKSNLLSSM